MIVTASMENKNHNLVISGKCGTGKTALATMLGEKAIEQGYKVKYIKSDALTVYNALVTCTLLFTTYGLRNICTLFVDSHLVLYRICVISDFINRASCNLFVVHLCLGRNLTAMQSITPTTQLRHI